MSWDQTVKKFEQAPTGTKLARCYSLVDLGTQRGEYKGKATIRHQVILGFELPKDLREDGKPFFISKWYTVSLAASSNLRKDLESWRGQSLEGDQRTIAEILMAVLGKPAILSIVDVDGRSRIEGIMTPPEGVEIPAQVNKSFVFKLDEFQQEKWEQLPDGIKEIIRRSPEYKQLRGLDKTTAKLPEEFDDDIPF